MEVRKMKRKIKSLMVVAVTNLSETLQFIVTQYDENDKGSFEIFEKEMVKAIEGFGKTVKDVYRGKK